MVSGSPTLQRRTLPVRSFLWSGLKKWPVAKEGLKTGESCWMQRNLPPVIPWISQKLSPTLWPCPSTKSSDIPQVWVLCFCARRRQRNWRNTTGEVGPCPLQGQAVRPAMMWKSSRAGSQRNLRCGFFCFGRVRKEFPQSFCFTLNKLMIWTRNMNIKFSWKLVIPQKVNIFAPKVGDPQERTSGPIVDAKTGRNGGFFGHRFSEARLQGSGCGGWYGPDRKTYQCAGQRTASSAGQLETFQWEPWVLDDKKRHVQPESYVARPHRNFRNTNEIHRNTMKYKNHVQSHTKETAIHH